MSSTSTSTGARGPGRRPGLSPETLEKARHYLELTTRYGVPVATIAESDGVAPSHVWDLLKKARAAETSPAPASVAAPGEVEPQPPRRLNKRVARARAWDYAEEHLISRLGLDCDAFWVRLVVAIHEDGDGFQLRIGATGGRFRSREDLVDLFGRRKIEIDDWLAALFSCGRLINLDGVDIGIPPGLGLIPGENARGKRIASRPGRPEGAPQLPLRFPFQVVQGSLSDSGEITPLDSGKNPISPESDSGEIPPLTPVKSPILPESQHPAPVTVTSTITKENQSLSGSGSDDSRAQRTPVKLPTDSGEIPSPDSTDISSQRPADGLSELAEELAALAGLPVPVQSRGLGFVHRWHQHDDFTRNLVLDVFRSVMARKNRPPSPDWSYFDKAMCDALKAAKASPAATAAPAEPSSKPPPRSEADLALDARLEALHGRWAASKTGPQPPLREGLDAACRAWKPADAMRWLGVVDGLLAAGLLADVDLPEFHDYVARPNRFEDQMIEAEEALTSPDTS